MGNYLPLEEDAKGLVDLYYRVSDGTPLFVHAVLSSHPGSSLHIFRSCL